MEIVSQRQMVDLHPTGDHHPETGGRLRGPACCLRTGRSRVTRRASRRSSEHTAASTSRGLRRSARTPGSTATRRPVRRRGRRRASPPDARSAQSRWEASPSSALRDTTRCPIVGWASASSVMQRSPPGMLRPSSESSGSRSSTGTCITATAPRRSCAGTSRSCSCRCTSGRYYPGTGGPDTSDATVLNIPLAAGSGDAAYANAFRSLVEPAVQSFEPGAPDRLGGIRCARR